MPRKKTDLSKRVRRYADVSAKVAGFGARAAGEKVLGIKADRQKQAERLRLALGGLKGPLMKIAQILSSIPDVVPKEYAVELAQLQQDAPSMGWSFVRRRMVSELGVDWPTKFEHFEHEASAAASLGQVHKAIGLDGRLLACKLQYPDMEAVIEADLRQLKIILALFEMVDRAVSTGEVQKEIAERLYEEMDYVREARNMTLYRAMLAKTEGVHVPEPIGALSTDRLLTMTWLEGQRFAAVADTSGAERRNAVALNMFRAWYEPFYGYGIIHGDPHMGNYTVCGDDSINLMDFGCIRVFRPELVQAVLMLYGALRDGREGDAVEAYRIWGFDNPSKALVDVLNIWAKFIYAPLLEDKTRPIEETNTGIYGRETANRVHAELRKLGGVTVPREFVFMDRAAIGLGAVFLRLRATLNWYRVFHDVVQGFDVPTVRKRQKSVLKASGFH